MKVTKILSAVLAICMIVVILPTFAVAKNSDEKKITVKELMGDLVKDDQLTTADAVMLLRSIVGFVELTDEQSSIADANMDSEINIGDAVYILRVVVALEEALYRESVIMESFEVKYESGLPTDVEIALPMAEMVEEESTYTVAAAPVLEGYTFLSWYASFNGKDYNAGETFVMPSEAVTLTARWEGIELPTPTPTDEPTPTPTEEPTPTPDGEAKVTLKFFDSFNEVEVSSSEMGVAAGTTTLNAENITLPEGYKLADADFSATVTVANGVATPSTVTVNVVPVVVVDDVIYTEVHNTTGFDNIADDLAGSYMLTEDLDFANVNRMPMGWNWTDPSADDVPFTGVFDGNGHTITGLYIDHTNNYPGGEDGVYDFYSNVGLFCINDGTIKNLNIYTRLYDGQTVEYGVFGDVNVGVVAGKNNGLIENCHVFGNVGSLDYIESTRGGAGGITGNNTETGVVTRCSFEGGVEGFYWIGGLIGKNFGTLTESYFAGGINSNVSDTILSDCQIRYIGGLCGGAQNATIKDSYTFITNDILAYNAVGGIVGWLKGGNLSELYVYSVGSAGIGYVSGYAGEIAGYIVAEPTYANLYTIEDENTELPAGFSTEKWDMNGACYANCPDLTKNRRGEILYSEVDG